MSILPPESIKSFRIGCQELGIDNVVDPDGDDKHDDVHDDYAHRKRTTPHCRTQVFL